MQGMHCRSLHALPTLPVTAANIRPCGSLPAAPLRLQPGRVWERVVDTSLQPPEDALLEGGQPVRALRLTVAPKAVVVLQAAVLETPNFPQTALPQ